MFVGGTVKTSLKNYLSTYKHVCAGMYIEEQVTSRIAFAALTF